jgi:NAD-dependent deacetylase
MLIPFNSAVQKAAHLIKNASNVVVFTGAGLSTPSGIPDFRSSKTGLWEKHDPMEVATLTSFRLQPEIFFDWLRPLICDICNAKPNAAHFGLAELEKKGVIRAVITQNIDNLHQRAGSTHISELHGSIEIFTCLKCNRQYQLAEIKDIFFQENGLPECPHCSTVLKPGITLFEEMLPVQAWADAEKASRTCDLMIVIGSSLTVYPAAQLPIIAMDNNSRLILINLTPTPMDQEADVTLPFDAAQVVPELVKSILN